ncbi:hypothetical protein HBI24_251240 [Parastagonospora nodorum]|nr:hypothetical protein HBI24_251240 [Parastagonospora nodorum]
MTNVVLRKEVLPLNIASKLTYLDKLKRFNGIKGDITRSSKVKYCRMFDNSCDDSDSNSNAKI